jgi:hypothetical protein
MAKKEPVPFKNSDELDAIDQELSDAMVGLDGANARIEDLLSGIVTPENPADSPVYSEVPEPDEEPDTA